MGFGFASGDYEGKKMEMNQRWWLWEKWSHGAGRISQGISGEDVSREYILEYETDYMLSEVRWQVVECACMKV